MSVIVQVKARNGSGRLVLVDFTQNVFGDVEFELLHVAVSCERLAKFEAWVNQHDVSGLLRLKLILLKDTIIKELVIWKEEPYVLQGTDLETLTTSPTLRPSGSRD